MGTEHLDALIRKYRGARAFLAEAAPAAAEAMGNVIRKSIAAGTTPEGEPWAPRKKDGGRALVNAAAKLNIGAVGTKLIARITFPDSLHNRGIPPNTPQRRILPESVTPEIAEAISDALEGGWRSRA